MYLLIFRGQKHGDMLEFSQRARLAHGANMEAIDGISGIKGGRVLGSQRKGFFPFV